jgi:hypothetical protein
MILSKSGWQKWRKHLDESAWQIGMHLPSKEESTEHGGAYLTNNSIHPLFHFLSSCPQSHDNSCSGLNLLPLAFHYNPSLQPDSPTLRLSLNSASVPIILDNTFAWKCTASDERGILRHKN